MIKDILKSPLINFALYIGIITCAYVSAASIQYRMIGNALYMFTLGAGFTVVRQWIFVADKKKNK